MDDLQHQKVDAEIEFFANETKDLNEKLQAMLDDHKAKYDTNAHSLQESLSTTVRDNIQNVKEIRVDCDNDCILIKIDQVGDAACHTGFQSCFYRVVKDKELIEDGVKVFNPEEKYGESK